MFESGTPTRARQGTQLTMREWVEAGAARIDEDLRNAPEAQAEIRVALASALLEFGATAEANTLLDAAVAYLRTDSNENTHALLSALELLSRAQRIRGDLESSQRTIDEALIASERIADTQLRLDARLRLRTYQLTLANAQARPEAALLIGRALLADRSARYGANDIRLAVDWNNLGATLIKLEQPQAAEAALARALELLRADKNSPELRQATVLGGLCVAQLAQGKLVAAMASAEQSRLIATRTLNATSYLSYSATHCNAAALGYRGQHQEALSTVDALLALGDEPEPDLRRRTQVLRGSILRSLGRIDEAEQVLSQVRKAFAIEAHSTPLISLEADLAFAQALAQRGEHAQALHITETALTALVARAPKAGYKNAELRMRAAAVLALSGQRERALSLHAQGLALWRSAWSAGDTQAPVHPLPAATAPSQDNARR
jgi:hypothetical protein